MDKFHKQFLKNSIWLLLVINSFYSFSGKIRLKINPKNKEKGRRILLPKIRLIFNIQFLLPDHFSEDT